MERGRERARIEVWGSDMIARDTGGLIGSYKKNNKEIGSFGGLEKKFSGPQEGSRRWFFLPRGYGTLCPFR